MWEIALYDIVNICATFEIWFVKHNVLNHWETGVTFHVAVQCLVAWWCIQARVCSMCFLLFFFSLSKTWSHSFFAADWGYEAMLTLPSPCKDNLGRPDHAVTHTCVRTHTHIGDVWLLFLALPLWADSHGGQHQPVFIWTDKRGVNGDICISPSRGCVYLKQHITWGNTWLLFSRHTLLRLW